MPGSRNFPGPLLPSRGFIKPVLACVDPLHGLSRGLVSCMPLGESGLYATDIVSLGNIGTFSAASTLSPSHHGGLSNLFVTATPHYVTFPKRVVVGTKFTVLAWVNLTNSGGGCAVAQIDSSQGNATFYLRAGATAGNSGFTSSGYKEVSTYSSLSTGIWHLVALRYDGTNLSYWVDSVQLTSVAQSGTPDASSNGNLAIGRLGASTNGPFPGYIDGVRIYNRALSNDEMRLLYNEPYAGLRTYRSGVTGAAATLYTLAAAVGTFVLTGQASLLLRSTVLQAGQGTFTLTGRAAILGRLITILAGVGTFTLTGRAANLLWNRSLPAAQGTFTLTGRAAGLLKNTILPAAQGTFTLTGRAAGLFKNFVVSAAQGTFALTGKAANLLRNRVVSAAQGTFTLTGKPANLLYSRVLAAAQGAYNLAGQSVTLTYNSLSATYTLIAAAGAYVLTGVANRLLYARIMPAAQGTFTLTGRAAGLFKNRVLTAVAGAYNLTGQNAGLLASRILSAAQGTFTLTGRAAGLLRNRFLSAASGTFTLTGRAASFARTYVMSAVAGAYSLAGQIVNLVVINAHFGSSPQFIYRPLSRLKSFTAKVRSRKFTPEG